MAFAGFVPDYSDGVAAVFNRLPWALRGIPGASYAATVAESPRLRNAAEYQAALGQTTTQVFPISPGDKLQF